MDSKFRRRARLQFQRTLDRLTEQAVAESLAEIAAVMMARYAPTTEEHNQ